MKKKTKELIKNKGFHYHTFLKHKKIYRIIQKCNIRVLK